MFTDPLSVTYESSTKTLPRTGQSRTGSSYRSADGEFQVSIWNEPVGTDGVHSVSIQLSRRVPDPTPANAFDAYRPIVNGFTISYQFDDTRFELDDLQSLRTALLALVNTGFETRLLAGEK